MERGVCANVSASDARRESEDDRRRAIGEEDHHLCRSMNSFEAARAT